MWNMKEKIGKGKNSLNLPKEMVVETQYYVRNGQNIVASYTLSDIGGELVDGWKLPFHSIIVALPFGLPILTPKEASHGYKSYLHLLG